MSFSAVIFDLDGTVIADEDEYGAAFAKVLRSLGAKATSSFPHVGGIGVKENWPILLAKYNIKTDKSIEQLTKETQDAYLSQLGSVALKKGFEDFINKLKQVGILTALATSNAWWMVEKIFKELGLEKFFDVITTGEEVRFKKPDPDIFCLTADKLGVDRRDCLVFEDSKAGITAAHGAGMKVIGIYRDNRHAKELKNADLLIKDFRDLNFEEILNL